MYNRIDITKSSHPAEWALILRCFPSYRKRKANIVETESTELSGRYWDDGSKSVYRIIHVHGEIVDLGDRSDYPFQAPDIEVDLLDGTQVVQCGIFCGRPGQAYLYRKQAVA